MREDRLTGKMTSPQMMWMHLILGGLDGFSYGVGGSTVEFLMIGKSKIAIGIDGARVRIEITLNLAALGSEAMDAEDVAPLLRDEIASTIAYCQAIPADPFGFSEIASRAFLTKNEWRNFNWLEHFQSAEIQVNINIAKLGT